MTEVLDRPVNGHALPEQIGPRRAVIRQDDTTEAVQAPVPAPEQPAPAEQSGRLARLFGRSTETGPRPTRRVRKLQAAQAERRDLRVMQDDPVWTEAESPKAIRERVKSADAERVHRQSRNPARQALTAARWRRNITLTAGFGLVLALSVSTANVQATVAKGAEVGDGRWLFAWTVEPAIAVLLLSLFAYRAFMATRGEVVEDRTINVAEWALLATTFTLNTWQYLPLISKNLDEFSVVDLVAHGVWPILAVLIVTCLPRIWAGFADLDHGGPAADPELVEALALVRGWMVAKRLPINPTRIQVERELRTWVADGGRLEAWGNAKKTGPGTRLAQRVHRCLTGRTELL
jgi:hypothetical protein